MNINMEKRFLEAPTVEMPRSNVDLSYEHQTTFNVGELIPIGCQQVYPGDTHKITTSKVIRLQTLLNPIYGTLYADIRHFFVPNRLVDEHFEELMGANKTSAWYPKVEYTTPMLAMNEDVDPPEPGSKADPVGVPLGSLPDYFGVPVGYTGKFNAQPIRAYHKVWDDWYRDENLQDPLNIYIGQATHIMSDADADYLTEYYMWPRKAARMHDMFSSCLPGPQKSSDPVTIPIGSGTSYLPVYPRSETLSGAPEYSGITSLKWYDMENYVQYNNSGFDTQESNGMTDYYTYNGDKPDEFLTAFPNNLWAEYNIDSVTMASINDLRQAFQIQRLLERDAYAGSRYVEILKAHFGVTSADARLQRSEYLGGNRIPLNVHQVVNSSSQGEVPLGELGAMSHTVDIHEDFVKSFTEHGWLITVCCVRYQNVYAQGLERFWSLSDRYSYYWPVLAHLGNQAVLNKEIYALGDADDNEEVFGYQEAWYDLRTRQNRCSSELRPGVPNSLATWNLADYYTETPVLSDDWIQFQPDIVDRVLAVGHNVSKQIFADFYFENHATRVIPLYSIPGMIDHF